MGSTQGRNDWQWIKLSRRLRQELAGQPCWLCGKPIDQQLDRRHPMSFTLDHVVPLSVDPSRSHDPANLRPSHRRCNGRRGKDPSYCPVQPAEKTPPPTPIIASRVWR
ncbi:HNH endonuclease [Skermania sp. ID1734]|uniref:HNH endonuclease n=1 Tax=Skermania sp. ID1734 TaxID=2597516 RepID=UPI00117E105F|nr:HNH endonuclease [Skermania sp. ID1734]TSD95041.1 HNH endonuclease [Skermania sp. ID1734]